jgi:hypothetical protein
MAEQDADNSGLAEGRMTLIGHLTELRNRLGVALGVFLAFVLVSVAPLPGHNKQQHRLSGVCVFAGAIG